MYENLIDPQIQILERCQVAWDNMASTPEDLSSYVPGLTKTDITKSFPMIIAKLNNIKAQTSEVASPFLVQTLSQSFTSWTTPLEGWIATSPANTPSIYSHLITMWSQLIMFDSAPYVPKVEDVLRLVAEIKRLEGVAEGHVKAIAEKDNTFEEKRGNVIEQCDQIIAKATQSLAAASRAGLAKSFADRATEYDKPRKWWFILFLTSLAGLVLMAALITLPEIKKAIGVERLYYFVVDIPLMLPFVWLAWFSALRFSQLGRLKEDYKFKVASALALDGYREQAEDLNSPALQEKLLDIAITNFGENPLRLMTKDSAKDAHPLAGAFDDKTIIEVIKALSDRVRK